MPNTLPPIPVDVQIVEPQAGTITQFFRLAWETLRNTVTRTPDVASSSFLAKSAALPTTTLYTTLNSGLYRISVYARITVADGVSSSLTVTLGWTEGGTPFTKAGTAMTGDTTGTICIDPPRLLQVDANTNLTVATTYASNTAAKMNYELYVVTEFMA